MEKKINTSKEQDKLEKTVANLFSQIYSSHNEQTMEEFYNRQILVLVILWSIFEKECIVDLMQLKIQNIGRFVKSCHSKVHQKAIEPYFNYFNSRYRKDVNNYHSLLNYHDDYIEYNNKNYDMYKIMDKDKPELNSHDIKLLFLIYIIYRFRCNIFHGNKEIFDWKNNKTPINYCCKALIQIIYNIHPKGFSNKEIPK